VRHPFNHPRLNPAHAAGEMFGDAVLVSPALRLDHNERSRNLGSTPISVSDSTI